MPLASTEFLCKILREISENLKISEDEAFALISNTLSQDNPEESLVDTLGFDQIENIFVILENKQFFCIQKEENREYVEYKIPISYKSNRKAETMKVPDKISKYFSYRYFNAVQTKVFEMAYKKDSNFLVAAPTGSGKTDVALLAILRELEKERSLILYVVPIKALAAEVAEKYSKRLKVKVEEFTGDSEISFTKASDSRIIICTPEKFDVCSRKVSMVGEMLFSRKKVIKLVIIDEIHLLQENRGPVVETLVCRLQYLSILQQSSIRILGLSATLPNCRDVGNFIGAEKVFEFGEEFRPVTLEQVIVGFKKEKLKFDYLVEKLLFFNKQNKQSLIIIPSRLGTEFLAKKLSKESVGKVAVHHGGLSRSSRKSVESLFRLRKIDVLICTTTLAWGVNLPANSVFIYETKFYDFDRGKFENLGILDVLQIFGRAGRLEFQLEKVNASAFLLCDYSLATHFYLKKLFNKNPIESKLLNSLREAILSEIYLHNIRNSRDSFTYLQRTFLYQRIMKNPETYGINTGKNEIDSYLMDFIHRVEEELINNCLINTYETTFYGAMACLYYVDVPSMREFMHSTTDSFSEIINLLLSTRTFSNILLRSSEEKEVQRILEEMLHRRLDCMIDVKELLEILENDLQEESGVVKKSVFTSVNIVKRVTLLLADIYKIKVSLPTLLMDMKYIKENVNRMAECLIRIYLYRKEYEKGLMLYKLIHREVSTVSIQVPLINSSKYYCYVKTSSKTQVQVVTRENDEIVCLTLDNKDEILIDKELTPCKLTLLYSQKSLNKSPPLKYSITERHIKCSKAKVNCVIIDPLPYKERMTLINYKILSILDINKPFVIYTSNPSSTILELNILINKEEFKGINILNNKNVLGFNGRVVNESNLSVYIKGSGSDCYFKIIEKSNSIIYLFELETTLRILINQ